MYIHTTHLKQPIQHTASSAQCNSNTTGECKKRIRDNTPPLRKKNDRVFSSLSSRLEKKTTTKQQNILKGQSAQLATLTTCLQMCSSCQAKLQSQKRTLAETDTTSWSWRSYTFLIPSTSAVCGPFVGRMSFPTSTAKTLTETKQWPDTPSLWYCT